METMQAVCEVDDYVHMSHRPRCIRTPTKESKLRKGILIAQEAWSGPRFERLPSKTQQHDAAFSNRDLLQASCDARYPIIP